MLKVLVMDGRSRAALQIVRSLGKKNFRVYVGDEFKICTSFFSKYSYKNIVYPSPNTSQFLIHIIKIIKQYKIDLIIPVRDDTTIIFSKYKIILNRYTKLLVADIKKIMIGRDKYLTMIEAEKIGIPLPKTELVKTPNDIFNSSIHYPFVLKPCISSGSRGLYIVKDEEYLLSIIDTLFINYDRYLIQEYIGTDEGVVGANVIYNYSGELISIFTYRRLRDYPRGNGPSVLRKSIYHSQVSDYTRKLFDSLKWVGVAMVEYKIDRKDGIPKLMEINPRFWGSLALPIASGVDFPVILKNIVFNEAIIQKKYKENIYARWFLLGDILWFLKSDNIIKDAFEFFKFFKKDQYYDIASWSDPLPSIGAILEGILRFLNKSQRDHVFRRGNNRD